MFYISIKNLIKFILLTIWVFPILLFALIFLEEQSENLVQKFQDFRYIWFIILLCPIILMITLLSKREV